MTGKSIVREAGAELKEEADKGAISIVKDILAKKKEYSKYLVKANDALKRAESMTSEEICIEFGNIYLGRG